MDFSPIYFHTFICWKQKVKCIKPPFIKKKQKKKKQQKKKKTYEKTHKNTCELENIWIQVGLS